MKTLYHIFLTSLICLQGAPLMANERVVLSNAKEVLDVSPYLLVLEDTDNKLTIEQVQHLKFNSLDQNVPNLGITQSTIWVKLEIQNQSSANNLMLELSLPILDHIWFYSEANEGKYSVIETGESFPFSHREIKDPNYFFYLDLPQREIKTYYLKIESTEAIQLPIKIGTRAAFDERVKNRDLLSGIYFGIMLVMILYNLFVYFTVKDKSYIYYVVYILLILLTQTSLQGYPFQYLWPNQPIIAKYSLFIFPSLVSVSGILFMLVFLKVKTYSKRLYRLSFLFFTTYSISIILVLFAEFQLSYAIMEFSSMTVSAYMLLTAIHVSRKGYQPAKYFVAAWSVFLCGVIIYILKDFGILPFNDFTRYTMHIGSGIETILLSFALAARINIYKKERLEAVQEKEELLREQNIVLEEKVEERTKELNDTLDQLKNTQVQLVESEKMSSLGQLTAGIAHEINNPINFVSSNVGPLRQDLDDLGAILKKYEELDSINVAEKLLEVEQLKQELDYSYLKTELASIVNGIEDGARRTTEIVRGLRNFSRLDEDELKYTDINSGIESSLILIKNKLGEIQLETKLCDKAEIQCNPGKINQVIMNLIDNAIEAVKDRYGKQGTDGRILIQTKSLKDEVELTISDNGCGIPEEIRSKIFDPFYTTRDVGQGTGLGLSIVRGILDNHKATCKVQSSIDEGTTFIITLPKKSKNGKN